MARKIVLKAFDELQKSAVKDYKEMLLLVLRQPKDPRQGVCYDEMRKSLALMETVEKATGTLLVEEEEWNELASRVKTFPFVMSHPELLEFMEAVLEAEKVEVVEAD